jgi:Transposase family tnp2
MIFTSYSKISAYICKLKRRQLLRWHVDGRKDDGMLCHPGDSPEWRNINRIFKDFGDELRNLRLRLCTDGMNPYGLMSSGNTTWYILFCIYNLSLVIHEKKLHNIIVADFRSKTTG